LGYACRLLGMDNPGRMMYYKNKFGVIPLPGSKSWVGAFQKNGETLDRASAQ